ncbi:MAG: hypothetical protein AUI91_12680 [Acidobacteria bacterium 13_1_40CM_3_56_11]|nr:MAG: hypothetical protein AUI91_12680 [Acidobacteria bacterium 13_1_40CM_3_56_11]
MRKMSQKRAFLKIVLDRKSNSVYSQDTSVVCPGIAGNLTEREEQTMRHEDKSQDAMTPRRQGLVDCLFARL